ncbi:MAG TPA: APC family permease [Steroidobacteraceae bacterium]
MQGSLRDSSVNGRKWTLHRSLNAVFGVAVGVGSMVGVGILRVPGVVFEHVGSASAAMLVWIAGAAYVLLCVNYMSELGTAIPRSGGPYAFAQRALGRPGAIVVGWSDFMNSVYAMALLAVALAEYTGQLLPSVPLQTPAVAVLLLGVFTTINAIGVDVASGTQKLTSLIKLIALWSLVASCLFFAPARPEPSSELSSALEYGVTALGAIAAFQLVLGAFNGWAAPAYFGGEARSARSIPRALLVGALLVSITYLGVNLAVFHAVPVDVLASSKLPVADALERLTVAHGWEIGAGASLVTLLVVLSLPSTLHAVTMQTSRTFHAMSQDALFFRWAARVNRRGSPVNATLICGAVAALLAMSNDFEVLFKTFTVFAVLNNLIMLCAVVRLRMTEPDLPRPFRVIGYPWALIPVVIVDCAVFVGFAAAHPWQSLAGVLVITALYVAYHVYGSKVPGSTEAY